MAGDFKGDGKSEAEAASESKLFDEIDGHESRRKTLLHTHSHHSLNHLKILSYTLYFISGNSKCHQGFAVLV